MPSDVISSIRYITGDATSPAGDGPVIIAHVCNDIGAWGSGFVMAVSARWPEPLEEYLRWREDGPHFELGYAQMVAVSDRIVVANMIAQHGTAGFPAGDGLPPIRYEALSSALAAVGALAQETGASVHMPRIGCGLAGGRWDLVEPVIEWQLCRRGVPVFVYDLPGSQEARAREPLYPSEDDGRAGNAAD